MVSNVVKAIYNFSWEGHFCPPTLPPLAKGRRSAWSPMPLSGIPEISKFQIDGNYTYNFCLNGLVCQFWKKNWNIIIIITPIPEGWILPRFMTRLAISEQTGYLNLQGAFCPSWPPSIYSTVATPGFQRRVKSIKIQKFDLFGTKKV